MMEYNSYLKQVYASWLGKIIGVRLGSPVENWSAEKIENTYHGKKGYLVDYDIYASDDDTNGPLFFIRALEKGNNISAEDIGNTLLAYLQEYSGFFWWGGVGISSEHTAYENLKNGIKAPQSGSSAQNGIVIAEQIGGQIFSDCWGYVSLADPGLAKRLASLASSVTHDSNGIEGGIFIAVAIALAYSENDILTVIKKACTYLNPNKEYYQKIQIILDYYHNHSDDWHDCLKFIQDNYGYDKYQGVCHIIPNLCIMIMGMCYGDNDFSKTLTIINEAGWDTDCNCGNVGSIMGALKGLEGIDKDWIVPINDTVNGSSCIGYLNIQTISESAKYFAKLAFRLKGQDIEDDRQFDLPYATLAFRSKSGKPLLVRDSCLVVKAEDYIYKYSYYKGEDIYDSRYDPCFSPTVLPGDIIEFSIEDNHALLYAFAQDCTGAKEYSKPFQLEKGKLIFKLNKGKNKTINFYGLEAFGDIKEFKLRHVQIRHQPDLLFEFKNYPIDIYGPRYEGDSLYNLRAWVFQSGNWHLEDDGLHIYHKDHFLAGTASPFKANNIEARFIGEDLMFVFGMEDARHYEAVGLQNGFMQIIHRDDDSLMHLIIPEYIKEKEYHLNLQLKENEIVYNINGYTGSFIWENKIGLVGICSEKDADICIKYLHIN